MSAPAARLPAPVTGLRFFAALQILMFHFFPAPALGSLGEAVILRGYVAVTLFFVMSGYAMATTRRHDMSPEERRRFWTERALRLYPAYLIAFALALPRMSWAVHKGYVSVREMAVGAGMYLGMVHAWSPRYTFLEYVNRASWSVPVIAFACLVHPFAVRRLTRMSDRKLVTLGAAACCLSLGLAAASWWLSRDAGSPDPVRDGETLWQTVLHGNPAIRSVEFIVGVTAGVHAMRHPGAITRAAPWLLGVGLCGWAALLVVPLPWDFLHNGVGVPFAVATLLGFAHARGRIARWMGSRWLVRLGAAGYAMFVFQCVLWPYWRTACDALLGDQLPVLRYVAFWGFIAWISVVFTERIERPLRNAIGTLVRSRRTRPAPACDIELAG